LGKTAAVANDEPGLQKILIDSPDAR